MNTSDLRKRIPDVPALRSNAASGSRLAADNPRSDRGGKFDTGKSDTSRSDTGRSGSSKFDNGKSGTGKSEAGRSDASRFNTSKSSSDRPKISDLRKRIPDVSEGRLKPADGRGKTDGGGAKLPSTKHIDGAKIPDLGGRTGPRTPLDVKPGMKMVSPGGAGMPKDKGASDALPRARFPDRVKKGELDGLTHGQVGQKIKLADQYRLAQEGDVARRLALHNPGVNVANVNRMTNIQHVNGGFHPHPDFHYRGWVSPAYHRHCFEYRCHFGPAWYPGIWWYPRWVPWVHWSWYHPCHPFWDPRPIWCRPVVYVAVAQPWVYWDCPVWTPLPAVSSGTWVEVRRPAVPEAQYDLQLLAVRFVDPGHPDEKLGPRYRVWFRNNSGQAITQGFDVRLFATPDAQLVHNAPQAGVRVTAIEAGDTQSVDIRLPFEVARAPADAQGKPPFQYLHAIADANREIEDVNRANNGARVATAEVLPVDPAAFEADPTTVGAGGEIIVAGEGFGPEPGKAIVHLGSIEMEAQVLGWYDLGVRLKMPDLPLAGATKADLVIIRGDGAAANPLTVTVNPPQRDAPAPEINAPALPPIPAPPKPAPVR